MNRQIFVNLGVRDLKRSMDFFGRLGFAFEPKFTNDRAACMVVRDDIYTMLLTPDMMRHFTDRPLADAHQTTEVLVSLSCDTRAEVDALIDRAVAAGGTATRAPIECGSMYGRSFEDPDGHIWELIYMGADSPGTGGAHPS